MTMMTLTELFAAMTDEQARGVQGKATREFWAVVIAKLERLSTNEVHAADRGDLQQRAVEAALKKIESKTFEYRGPKAFTAWLRGIVKYEALKLDHKRARLSKIVREFAREPVDETDRSPTSTVFAWQQWQAIREAMKLLTPVQREALEYVDTHALAEAKGILLDTARKQRRRAENALRRLLR